MLTVNLSPWSDSFNEIRQCENDNGKLSRRLQNIVSYAFLWICTTLTIFGWKHISVCCMLFINRRLRVGVSISFSVWLVGSYSHIYVILSIVIVTLTRTRCNYCTVHSATKTSLNNMDMEQAPVTRQSYLRKNSQLHLSTCKFSIRTEIEQGIRCTRKLKLC